MQPAQGVDLAFDDQSTIAGNVIRIISNKKHNKIK